MPLTFIISQKQGTNTPPLNTLLFYRAANEEAIFIIAMTFVLDSQERDKLGKCPQWVVFSKELIKFKRMRICA